MDRPDDGHGARTCPRRVTGTGESRKSSLCPEAALDHAPVDVPKEDSVFADADTLGHASRVVGAGRIASCHYCPRTFFTWPIFF